MDELAPVWEPDDDDEAPARDDDERPDEHSPPSSSEMAGDGAVGGDGIDEPGWD